MLNTNLLKKIEKYTTYALVVLFPLLVLPFFPNLFETPKLILLVLGLTLLILTKVLIVLSSSKLEVKVGDLDLPLLFLSLSYLISAIFRTPNKMEAFFLPGNASFIIAGTLLFFFVNQLEESEKNFTKKLILMSAALVSTISLLATFGVFSKIPQLPLFIKDPGFNPIGNPLIIAIFAAALLPTALNLILKEKTIVNKTILALGSLLVISGLLVSLYNLKNSNPANLRFVGFKTSWGVAIDTLKESPILGIGPGNYLTAFNRFRGVDYNRDNNLWTFRFVNARNFYLTAITETGFLGSLSLIILFMALFKKFKKEFMEKTFTFELLSVLVYIAIYAFLPSSNLGIVLLLLLFSFVNKVKSVDFSLNGASAIVLSLPIILGLGVLVFFSSRAVAAEVRFKQALNAFSKADGKNTYDLLRKAITLNPFVDRYHSTFAQINLLLAQNIATKKDLTNDDRSTISQLINQAINEGKANVALNKERAGNWQLLAQIYRGIMGIAQGADNFAVQTYGQAVALDPFDPNLRISQGGVYYALGRFEESQRAFEFATLAKPDLANAHYNLASALREKGNIESAIAEMNLVLSLVVKDSTDYKLAKTELDNLVKTKPAKTETGSTQNLTNPKEAKGPTVKPPIELPSEASPPANVVSPSSPAPNASPTPPANP